MTDYRQVSEALAAGTAPALICATCPWDRHCLNPPAMSRAQVQAELDAAVAAGNGIQEDSRKAEGALATALVRTLFYAGKDTEVQACPVLCARLKSSQGRELADQVRAAMQAWDDDK